MCQGEESISKCTEIRNTRQNQGMLKIVTLITKRKDRKRRLGVKCWLMNLQKQIRSII